MGTLLSILSSGGFGIVTGMIGGWLGKREARKMKALDNAHDATMAVHAITEATNAQAHAVAMLGEKREMAVEVGKIEVEGKEMDVFMQSIKEQGKSTGSPFFDGLKSAIRPIITFWLLWELSSITGTLDKLTGGLKALPAEDQIALYITIIDAIIFLATTAVGWWFASRRGQV
jgi:hypothetical protein